MKNTRLYAIIAVVALALSMFASYSMSLANGTGTQLLGGIALVCGAASSAAGVGILRQNFRTDRKKA